MIDGPEADAFVAAAKAALAAVGPQTMLTDGIAAAYRAGRDRVAASAGVRAVLTTICDLRNATPYLFEVTGRRLAGEPRAGAKRSSARSA